MATTTFSTCSYPTYRHTGYTLMQNRSKVWPPDDANTTKSSFVAKEVLLCAIGDGDQYFQACCTSKGVANNCLKFCSPSPEKKDAVELMQLWPKCRKDWKRSSSRLRAPERRLRISVLSSSMTSYSQLFFLAHTTGMAT